MKTSAPLTILAATLLFFAACGAKPTPLQQTAANIHEGMEKTQVKELFSSFKLIGETNRFSEVTWATKSFGTNKVSASRLVYSGKAIIPSLESCAVFFDTNDIVVGYNYIPSN